MFDLINKINIKIGSNNIRKLILLVFLVFIFIFIIFCSFSDYFIKSEEIISSRESINGKNCNIFIDNMRGAYNSIDDTYYFSYNENEKNINSINIKSNENFKYKVLDKKIKNYNNGRLLIYNDKKYQIVNIKFINIPIISIYDKENVDLSIENINKSKIKNDSFIFISSNVKNDVNGKGYSFSCEYHERGNTSKKFPKKSYKINFDTDKYILGIPYGENYVLDSLYMDSSKVRNKLTGDLWNLVNDNQTIENDLYSEFVEVYINDVYIGLYTFKNSISKRIFSIDDSGYLLKAYNKFLPIKYSLSGEHIMNYVFKYTNSKTDTYNDLVNKVNYVLKNNQSYESMDQTFYMDNFINYILMIIFTEGIDNIDKNYYLSLNNSKDKLLITPWDLDLTFGNSFKKDAFNYEVYYFTTYKDKSIINKIFSNIDDKTKKILAERYFVLRKEVFNDEIINNYLNEYRKTLNNDIVYRDMNKWYNYNIDDEFNKISKWSSYRFKFLDDFFSNL